MTRNRRIALAVLAAAAALVPAGTASAGPVWDWLCGDCPRPSYSPLRYWTPTAARVSDCVHGPSQSVNPPDSHPEIPPTYDIPRYPCPAAPPAATIIPVPTRSAEAGAR
jgi:hypothetical protein